MRKLLLILFACCGVAFAQAATRPVIVAWTASTSTSVTGYTVYHCAGASCVPSLTSTPAATVSASPAAINETIGTVVNYLVVANSPACTATTPLTTACGNSAAVAVAPANLPIPPQVVAPTSAQTSVP